MKFAITKRLLILGLFSSIFYLTNAKEENIKSMPKAQTNKGTKSMVKTARSTKVAYVNIGKVIPLEPKMLSEGSHEWQEHFNRLQKTVEPADAELRNLNEKFEKGKKEFMDLQNSKIASEAAMKQKYEEVAKINMEMQQRKYERDQFVDSELNKSQMHVGPKIEKAIKQLRASQGWDMIIRGEYVIDADNFFDLTSEVLQIINNEFAQEKKSKETTSSKQQEEVKPAVSAI